MSTERWNRLKEVLDAVLDTDPPERPALLDQMCAGDPVLRSEAERMASEYEHMGEFLEGLPVPPEPATPQDSFSDGALVANRFRILRRIARGGMGAVYEAADMQLMGRRVALKTVRADLTGAAHLRDRLKQEVLTAREIVHPNVCPIYEFFEVEGPGGLMQFFTMRLIEGDTLKDRLERDGPYSPDATIGLAGQIAAGIDAAHAVGVIHRDFKPANVILEVGGSGTKPVITDFGLARSTDTEDTIFGGATHTVGIAGTPDYMAPEQFRSQPLTKAVDIYAFAVVLNEMVTGERPGPQGVARAKLPPGWAPVLERCLAQNPESRFQSAAEVVAELQHPSRSQRPVRRWAMAALAALLLIAGIGGGWRWMRASGPKVPLHVAVLPITVTGGEEDSAIADGVLDTIASDLGRIEDTRPDFISVPASEIRLRHVRSARDAVSQFGVNRVLSGKLSRNGPNVALDLEVTDGASRKSLGRTSVVCPSSEIYRLADYASTRAAELLDVELPSGTREARVLGGTTDAEAFSEYQRGREAANLRTLAGWETAIGHFQRALDLDNRYALAYASLGEALAAKYALSKDVYALELARRQVDRAVEIAPGSARVQLAAAYVAVESGQPETALKALDRVQALDPSNLDLLSYRARLYAGLGRNQDAEKAYREFVKLKPHNYLAFEKLGDYLYRQGRYDEAAKMFSYVIEMAPQSVLGYNNMAAVEMSRENYREAITLLNTSLSIAESAAAYNNLGTAYFMQGNYRAAVAPLQQACDLEKTNPTRWRSLGDVLSRIPERQREASRAFERAVEAARQVEQRNPQDAGNLSELALDLAKLNRKAEAVQTLAALDQLPVNDQTVQFRKAMALELAGKRREAIEVVSRLLASGFSETQVNKAPELERLREDPAFKRARSRPGASSTG
jgi:eukaryotic-like serine/threonine-protein kinase